MFTIFKKNVSLYPKMSPNVFENIPRFFWTFYKWLNLLCIGILIFCCCLLLLLIFQWFTLADFLAEEEPFSIWVWPAIGLLFLLIDPPRVDELASPCPASRRPSLQLMSMARPNASTPVLVSFWIDSKRLARSGVFLIWVRNSFNWGCLSEIKLAKISIF